MHRKSIVALTAFTLVALCQTIIAQETVHLRARLGKDGNSVEILRDGSDQPILTNVARPDHRPYIHPIVAPD
jgi:hypothetical protein